MLVHRQRKRPPNSRTLSPPLPRRQLLPLCPHVLKDLGQPGEVARAVLQAHRPGNGHHRVIIAGVTEHPRRQKGRFPTPSRVGEDFHIGPRELAMMLEGLEEASVRRRIRFELSRG